MARTPEDSDPSPAEQLVTLLAWLADVPTHQVLAARERLNGNCDLADIVEMWSEAGRRQAMVDCLQAEAARRALAKVFLAMDEIYCAPEYPNFGWMYFDGPLPKAWSESVRSAGIILDTEFPGALDRWPEAGRPCY